MMSRGRLALSVTVAAALCLAPAQPLFAQSAADKTEAGKLYKEGVESYFAADYAVAITKFREGFNLDPNAMFLYNLSLCFSKLGNFEEALENAEKAQEMGGMPDEAETKNKARLVAFTALVHSEEIAKEVLAEPAPGTCATNAECNDGEVCNIRRGVCVEEIPGGGDDPEPILPFSPIGWAGVGVGGLGLVLLATGGVFSIQVGGLQKEYDEQSASGDPKASETRTKLDKKKNAGRIILLSGLGATVVGAALVAVDLFVLKDEDGEPVSMLAPYAAPGEAGFTWSLRF